MITDFDLAERAGVSVEAVRDWLRRRGYGGKRHQRIPPNIEQAFLEAHGAIRERVDQVPAPVERVTRPIARPAPEPAARPSVLDRDNARRIADLQRELTDARAALQVAQAELGRRPVTRPVPEAAPPPPSAPPPAAPAPVEAPTVRDHLARQGLADAREAVAALEAAVASAPDALLDALAVLDPAVFERIQPVCAVVTCREYAGLVGWQVIPAGATRCAVCRGSDNRRWFRMMALRLERAGRRRLLVVGGSPDSHAALGRLERDAPKLDLRLVEGDQRLDATRARALVGGVDVVVFWASTLLDHAVSDVIKDAARREPRLIRAVTPPGGRGIAALCRAVVDALDQQARD